MNHRTKIYLALMVCLTLVACAKVEVKKEYYPDGKLMAEKTVKGQNSITRVYHRNGNLIGEYHYRNGVLHGTAIIYFNDGKIFQKLNYRKGTIKSKQEFDPDGRLVSKS